MSVKFQTRIADFSQAADRNLFVEWVFNTKDNLFDRKVMFYPTTNTILVERESCGTAAPGCEEAEGFTEPMIFLPFQATITLESIAAKPGITPLEMARALRAFHDGIENVCRVMKIREIYFIVADDRVAVFALNHGYTEINGQRGTPGDPDYIPSLAQWAKENGYSAPIKRVLKMKLPGPEDTLQPKQPSSQSSQSS